MAQGLKVSLYVAFVLILGYLLFQMYSLDTERRALKAEMASVSNELELISADNEKLKEQIEYYADPHNLEKELRARFNYRLPNEKLIIVVPEGSE